MRAQARVGHRGPKTSAAVAASASSRSDIEAMEQGGAPPTPPLEAKGKGEGATGLEEDKLGKASAKAYSAPPSTLHSFLAALSYGLASLSMVFLNKGVLMSYKFSMTLLTLQMLVTAVVMQTCAYFGWLGVRRLNWATAKTLLPVALLYNANVAFALASLQGVNVPMYIALKRVTPMAMLIVNFFIGKAKPPLQVTLSVITTTLGVVIAALGDFSFNPKAYGMALTSVGFQTAYLVLVEWSGAEKGLSSLDILLHNSVLSLPVLGLLILGTGEVWASLPLLAEKMAQSLSFSVALVMAVLMGIILNYTMFLCTVVNSALTTSIVGVLKGAGTTVLGFFLLGGVEVHALNVFGLAVNTLGGIWYSIVKYRMRHSKSFSAPVAKDTAAEPLLPSSKPTHSA